MPSIRSWSFLLVAVTNLAAGCGGRAADDPSPAPSPSGATPPGTTPPVAGTCESGASDIAVSSTDLNGFPPYAAAGCTLVYISSAGDLVSRDLASRKETVIAPSSERPRRPTASPDLVAWEADVQGVAVVRVRKTGSEATTTVVGRFVTAGEPRASGSSVAFTAWMGPSKGDDTDIWLYDAASGAAQLAIGGAGQQRFADLSSRYVVASDFGEDPDQRFDNDGRDLSDIVVVDRTSGVVTTRRAPGKQAFPMLAQIGGDDVLAYLAWSGIHPEPKLTAYALKGGPILGDPAADKTIAEVKYLSSEYARPAAVLGTIEWIANPDGRTTLYRAPADGSAPPTAVQGLDNLHLFAPAPSRGVSGGFTVLATLRAGGPTTEAAPRLLAVPR